MTDSSGWSRRRFLVTATASVFLKGCLGNPPDSSTGVTSSPAAAVVSAVQAGEEPEVTTAQLGYVPIVEAAPLDCKGKRLLC